ncbi:MAG: hypothetical protein IKM09_01280 [Clostridia bacterium]|nr:hypothetical protein [Clostridia bacterium]
MSVKTKNIIIVITSVVVLFSLSLMFVFLPKKEFSESERRPLASFPKLTMSTLLDGSFMKDFNTYAVENFPFRDTFRSLKAYASKYALLQLENHDLFIDRNGYVVKVEAEKEGSVEHALGRFEAIYDRFLKDKADNIYLSVIPDKNYYSEGIRIKLDYDEFLANIKNGMSYAEYIDIFSELELDDFYKTDTHWKQECLVDVANKLAAGMGTSIPGAFTEHTVKDDFYGVYAGQAALPLKPDTIKHLTSAAIDRATVYDYATQKNVLMFDKNKLDSRDAYDSFLNGARSAPVKITDPEATNKKTLVVFRDSYGSSIAPLLTGSYSEIILIDLRETPYLVLDQIVDFENADVLYLFSTLVFCDSFAIK